MPSDMLVKFHDPGLNPSLEIRPESIGASFSNVLERNFQPEVDSDVISCAIVDQPGLKVSVKFGDSQTVLHI